MLKYRCPETPNEDINGCGEVFWAEPDDEGLIDCPNCGIWFSPEKEPHTIVDSTDEEPEK